MRIYRDLISTTEDTAVALGYFDGVHLGHQQVLSQAVSCKEQGLVPVAFTFKHTPKSNDVSQQLLTLEQRVDALEKQGIEILYIIDFDKVKDYTPEAFAEKVLKNIFNAKKVFCGFNYRFGKNGAGDCETLKKLCNERNIEVFVSNPVVLGESVISSSLIRSLIKNGEIEKANEYLGYEFYYKSVAVKGNQIGTKIGTPTINQLLPEQVVLPKFGVYVSKVSFDGASYMGVTNVGIKPTIEGNKQPLCESWLPEYTGGDLYGKEVTTRLVKFIRKEKHFENLQQLKNQIQKDREVLFEM